MRIAVLFLLGLLLPFQALAAAENRIEIIARSSSILDNEAAKFNVLVNNKILTQATTSVQDQNFVLNVPANTGNIKTIAIQFLNPKSVWVGGAEQRRQRYLAVSSVSLNGAKMTPNSPGVYIDEWNLDGLSVLPGSAKFQKKGYLVFDLAKAGIPPITTAPPVIIPPGSPVVVPPVTQPPTEQPPATGTSLLISDLKVTDLNSTSLALSWKTSIKSRSEIFYKAEDESQLTQKLSGTLTSHFAELKNLKSNTLYYVNIREFGETKKVLAQQTILVTTSGSSEGVSSLPKYLIRPDKKNQTILGLGVELQSDYFGANDEQGKTVGGIPYDLTTSERTRLYKDLIGYENGFRYLRVAGGTHFRGESADRKNIIERFTPKPIAGSTQVYAPESQLSLVGELVKESGMEGINYEYWSPSSYWKNNKRLQGGGLALPADPLARKAFITDFTNNIVEDLKYFSDAGIPIAMFGLQNEPYIQPSAYGSCKYSGQEYYEVFSALAPKIKAAPFGAKTILHASSWNGQHFSPELTADPNALKYVDMWSWHEITKIGLDSQNVATSPYSHGTHGKPVFDSEFEYFAHVVKAHEELYGASTPAWEMVNTAQVIMNWMVYHNSPTFFWLHVGKPTYDGNDSTGFALSHWSSPISPANKTGKAMYENLKPGTWTYIPENWNAFAGFLKYMPWNSTRLSVVELSSKADNRIMAWSKPNGKLVFAVTNRTFKPYSFNVDVEGPEKSFKGHRFTISARDEAVGEVSSKKDGGIIINVPPLAIEFWEEK